MSPTVAAPTTAVASDTRPGRWRRHRTTLLIIAMLVLAVAVVILVGPSGEGRSTPLDPDNPGPEGAQAVARVLEDEGVDVSVVRSADRLEATSAGEGTTVVVTSAHWLGAGTVERLLEHAGAARVVVVDPPAHLLEALGVPGYPGYVGTDGALAADCTDGALDDLVGDLELEVEVAESYQGEGCFPGDGDGDGEGGYVLLAGERVTLLGAGDLLSNDQVLRADNAALALRLLGQDDRLVWYVASPDDQTGDDGVQISDLLPDWILPGLWVLALATVLLVVWRARRLGPLATEPLPVVVKAIETTLSRGRLYRKGGDRAHAAATLRAAARARAGARLRLDRNVDDATLVRDVARHTGRPEPEIGFLLSSGAPAPGSDRDLIALADALAALEEEVRHS